MKFLLSLSTLALFVLSACTSAQNFTNDDVYSVRPGKLPIGESMTDETSYAAYKTRKEGKTNDQAIYADQYAQIQRQYCLDMVKWRPGCGCSYNDWMMHGRFVTRNNRLVAVSPLIIVGGYYPYFMSYGSGFYNPYSAFNNPYGYYNYYNNPFITYNPYHSYNGYYGYSGVYGNPYGYYNYGRYYGYGGNNNIWGENYNSTSSGSHYYGHRKTNSGGYYNPTGRSNSPTQKSTHTVKPTNKGEVVHVGGGTTTNAKAPSYDRYVVKPISNTHVVQRNNHTVNFSRTTIQNNRSAQPSYERTYRSPASRSNVSSRPSYNRNVSTNTRTNTNYRHTTNRSVGVSSSSSRGSISTSSPSRSSSGVSRGSINGRR